MRCSFAMWPRARFFDFRRYFLDVGELFSPAQIFDLGATQMRFHYSVGLPQWLLALLGTLTVFSVRRRRLSVLFFAFAALGLAYIMLPASINVWNAIPQMAYFQFPTRFLGPAAVVFGVLAGAAVSWAEGLRWKWAPMAAAGAAVTVCILGAMPLLYPPLWPDFGPVSAQRILDTELNGRGIGTTSANDFLPVGAKIVPGPQPEYLATYTAGQVDKLNRATLPAGTQATLLHHGPEDDHYSVSGNTAFVFRVFTFYFPGWTAYVDGVKTAITLSEPEGWITFNVPAGTHDVALRLENTPVRWVGWGLSALAALGLAGLLIWRLRLPIERPQHQPLALGHAQILAALILGGMIFRAADDQLGWLRVQSTGHQALVAMCKNSCRSSRMWRYSGSTCRPTAGQAGRQRAGDALLEGAGAHARQSARLHSPDRPGWAIVGPIRQVEPGRFSHRPLAARPLRARRARGAAAARCSSRGIPGDRRLMGRRHRQAVRMHRLDANGQPTASDGIVLTDAFVARPLKAAHPPLALHQPPM